MVARNSATLLPALAAPAPSHGRRPAKPAWVRREVVRLKALMREDGSCRAVAGVFNRRFAARRNMTVGKTFVAEA